MFKALLFLGAGAVIHAAGTRDMYKMGGLGKQMPLVRVVFVIGALALAGLPITNGFFSKELVLETGLADGPQWAYLIMLLVAGLTGLYTLRMVMLVFYGAPKSELKAHDAPNAMRISLITLAFLTLTTWLLVGAFDQILAESLPYHNLEPESASVILREIVTSPSTWITVGFVLLVASIWFWRDRLQTLASRLTPLMGHRARGRGPPASQ